MSDFFDKTNNTQLENVEKIYRQQSTDVPVSVKCPICNNIFKYTMKETNLDKYLACPKCKKKINIKHIEIVE
jgi:DNA-directed RNA polymerase subunit RPC12/RpoP